MTERLNGTQTTSTTAKSVTKAGRHEAKETAGEEIGQGFINAAAGIGTDGKCDPVKYRAGGNGRHDGLQAAINDNGAIDGATQGSDQKHAHHAKENLYGRADDNPGGQAIGQGENHADGKINAGGDHHKRLGHGDEGQQHALVRGGLHHIGVKAGGMVRGIDDKHHNENCDCHQGAALFGKPEPPILHRCKASPISILSALAMSARSVISAPTSSRFTLPS